MSNGRLFSSTHLHAVYIAHTRKHMWNDRSNWSHLESIHICDVAGVVKQSNPSQINVITSYSYINGHSHLQWNAILKDWMAEESENASKIKDDKKWTAIWKPSSYWLLFPNNNWYFIRISIVSNLAMDALCTNAQEAHTHTKKIKRQSIGTQSHPI